MVKIGFLSRVRGFTFRGDLKDYIMASAEWKAAPFHFRLYFDAFTVKGKTAHVLMIDVDQPNIELGIRFFQQCYNGTLTNSPNNLPYMFWPLFKKSYTDDEHIRIITDNSHHIGNDSVIGLTGLQPIDNLVRLVNGTHTSIRRLLLSIPTISTTTGQLFLQVERQMMNEWLLCSFYQQDTSKVTIRLGTLEDSLRKCVHPDSISDLFMSDDGLTFTNQVAPATRGRNKLPRMEVPTYTADYVLVSMEKLYTPTTKRQAMEENAAMMDHTVQTAQVPRPSPMTYAVAAAPVTPITPTATVLRPGNVENQAVQDLQAKTTEHSTTLAELSKCCANMAVSQQQIANNIATMNAEMNTKSSELVSSNLKFNDRFNEMSNAIESLRSSSPTRPLKFYKEAHGPFEGTTFHG